MKTGVRSIGTGGRRDRMRISMIFGFFTGIIVVHHAWQSRFLALKAPFHMKRFHLVVLNV
jgi:hypothetical protein